MATFIKQSTSTLGVLNAVTPVVDISDADFVTLQISGTFVATVTFQGSNDNVTWYSFALHNTSITTATTDTITSTAGGVFSKPTNGIKFFRAQATSYASGTVTVDIYTSRYGK
jgi:hypothetical protein